MNMAGISSLDRSAAWNQAAPGLGGGSWSSSAAALPTAGAAGAGGSEAAREAFQSFVGQTFYGQMLKALRNTVDKPAYFHGGRAEEIFREQLDQVLAEKFSDNTADQFAGPMYELFMLNRQ